MYVCVCVCGLHCVCTVCVDVESIYKSCQSILSKVMGKDKEEMVSPSV